jgi:hypothetical protein
MRKIIPGHYLATLFLLLIFSILLAACGANQAAGQTGLKMAPMEGMPAAVKQAPVTVQQAYQFNVANPELMRQIPCYCGCGAMGHTSNYSCYVSGVEGDGKVNFETHALGCSICVDITQDAMRLQKEGKTAAEIRAYVDKTYVQYGPSNMP